MPESSSAPCRKHARRDAIGGFPSARIHLNRRGHGARPTEANGPGRGRAAPIRRSRRRSPIQVIEHKLRGQLLGLVIHLGADQNSTALRIDPHAPPLSSTTRPPSTLGVFHGVRHAGAAAVLDANPHPDDGAAPRSPHVFDTLGGGVGQTIACSLGGGCGHFRILSCRPVQGPAMESTMRLK
jgi:hypothetical protein